MLRSSCFGVRTKALPPTLSKDVLNEETKEKEASASQDFLKHLYFGVRTKVTTILPQGSLT
jgi:hypothetical protein